MFDDNGKAAAIIKLTPGHYNLETIAKYLSNAFTSYGFELPTEINMSVCQLISRNPKSKKLLLIAI